MGDGIPDGSTWQLLTWRGYAKGNLQGAASRGTSGPQGQGPSSDLLARSGSWISLDGLPAEIPVCPPLGVRVILVEPFGFLRALHLYRTFDAMDGRVVVDAILEPHVDAALAALA